jgi:hypothetical protein
MPTKFKLYTIGIESVKVNFRMYLSEENFLEISNIINVPNADSSEEYRVLDAHLHPDFAKKMPNIKLCWYFVGTSWKIYSL